MHQCQSCKNTFEMPPEPELGLFLRGRCHHCGTINVIVPGLGAAEQAAPPPRRPVIEDTPIDVAEEALDIVEDESGPAATAAEAMAYGGAVPEAGRRKAGPPPPPRPVAPAEDLATDVATDVDTDDL